MKIQMLKKYKGLHKSGLYEVKELETKTYKGRIISFVRVFRDSERQQTVNIPIIYVDFV
jgi:hypothetical protein